MPSTRLSRTETKMTNGPTRATVHPYRCSSRRDNPQQPVAPRRQGLRVPSPSRTGFFCPPPFCVIPTLVREYLLVTIGSWASVSLGCQPGVRVVPFFAWTVPGSPPFCSVRHCKVTHSPRREVVSRACHTEGAHPTASGRHALVVGVALFEQSALLTCGGWVAVSLGCQPASSESAPFFHLIALFVLSSLLSSRAGC